jgi:hypothetical protein
MQAFGSRSWNSGVPMHCRELLESTLLAVSSELRLSFNFRDGDWRQAGLAQSRVKVG